MVDLDIRRYLRRLEPIPSNTPSKGQLVSPIQVFLFDIYGTLFISGSGDIGVAEANTAMTPSLTEVLHHYRIEKAPQDLTRDLHQKIHDDHRQKKINGIQWPEVDIIAVWQAILGWRDIKRVRAFALAYEMAVNPCYPMPGLDHVLRVLRGRGVTLGLISNAQFYTPLLFEWFLGATPDALGFDEALTVYSYRCGEAKPSRTLFAGCATELAKRGVSPGSVVYVGNDMRNDIQPASEFAWQTVLFAGDRRSLRLRRDNSECRGILPDMVITDLGELLNWV